MTQTSQPGWRPLTPADLDGVVAVADVVHPDFPEDRSVFVNRLELFPDGCMGFDRGAGLEGYLVSHPARLDTPPPLDTCFPALPDGADCHYIHDLALLPSCRGSGAGKAAVKLAAEVAARHGFDRMALVAVNNSGAFWTRCGFRPLACDATRARLASYGEDALLMLRDLA
ncbi:GNAT family N-acetyltransferase [Novosphingobium resinovorum]|uniref:GNAT family N-acetyltransferase n=1 Tax=Novosphingobium resinovorum TaxID=158500 RepID=UPI002ED354E0|nr:GNAT family N-acetyltransferase [Novosphingobium resinovorum]